MTTPEESDENYMECICAGCPSYPGQGDKTLYCARGKSTLNIRNEGCICPAGCPVYSRHGLKDMFYCMYGKAR